MKPNLPLLTALFVLFSTVTANAHFGMVIPSDNMISSTDSRTLDIDVSFSHPFEYIGMDMENPDAYMVLHNGNTTDLLSTLKPDTMMGKKSWQSSYQIKRPGAHIFAMTPKPYWEPAEDCFIIHYTKTVVAAFGDDTGWDAELGLETEITPLTRPLGLYKGNSFQGIVKVKGKPVPFAEVEIEYYNENQKAKALDDLMITQVIKADQNGVFSYTVPAAGWWGFAALNTSDKKLVHDGEKKDIEIGAVIWVKFENFQED